jgi:sugar/nucleoside kinase (ribokinase family)
MVETACRFREQGVFFSLESIIDYTQWRNRQGIVALLQQVDAVTPDWPSASGIAGSDDPKKVVKYWSRLGPGLVAVRHGRYGSYVWDRDYDQIWQIPAVPAKVVDPTGDGTTS